MMFFQYGKFIGRKKECNRLDKCLKDSNAQLVIVYGRRVGKTFLINEYFNNTFAFKYTGAYKQSKEIQLRNFTVELNRKSKKEWTLPKDWVQVFEYFWNDFASARKNLIFIVCGSAISWMVENYANNRGGLFNRQTCRLYLEPFNLAQTKEYLENRNIYWSYYDIAE